MWEIYLFPPIFALTYHQAASTFSWFGFQIRTSGHSRLHLFFLTKIVFCMIILTLSPDSAPDNLWKWKLHSHVRLFVTPWTIHTVHGILHARILEWVAFPFSRKSSQPRIKPRSPALQVDSLPAEPQGKPKNSGGGSPSLLQGIFQTRELNPGLLHCRQILRYLSHQGSLPMKTFGHL